MKLCKDTETEKYRTLEMLASATSPSSQVSTNDADDTSQPRLLQQSFKENKQDTTESPENVSSCNSNEVHKDAMNGAYTDDSAGIKGNRQTSTDTGQTQATSSGPLTDHGNDGEISSATWSVDQLDKLDMCDHEVKCNDQLQQKDSFGIVSDRSDICFDHSDDYKDDDGQTLSNTDHTDHHGDHDGQSLSSTDHTDHHGDHDGQSLSNTDQLGDHDGQTLSNTDHTDHHGDHDGQSLISTDHTDHIRDHDGQSLSNTDHTDHNGDGNGQKHSNTDHTDQLDDHDGQTLTNTGPTDHLGDGDGQKHSSTDHTDHPGDHDGQLLRGTDHSNDHEGQPLCHVDQVVMLTRLPAPQIIMVDQSNTQSVSQ